MSQLPTVRQLQYFSALARHQHFGRAAEACFVSQPAFSVAIRELETLLGVQLVDRTRRQVTITPLGEEIATQARLCLREIADLVALAERRQGMLSGPLLLGVIPTIAPFILPRLLPLLRERYPKLELHVHEGRTDQICAELLAGELDLLLIALPWELRGIDTRKLFRDPFLLACHEHTRLIDPAHYRPSSLSAGSVLLLEDGHCLRDHALTACRLRNENSVSRFGAASFHTLLELVNQDLGITFVPELARDSALMKHTQIRTWPLDERAYRDIALAWRRGSGRVEEFCEFGELVKEARGAG